MLGVEEEYYQRYIGGSFFICGRIFYLFWNVYIHFAIDVDDMFGRWGAGGYLWDAVVGTDLQYSWILLGPKKLCSERLKSGSFN